MATITVTPGYNWVSGEVVTPAKMNLAAAPTASVSAIVDADVAAGAAIALSKLATGALPTAITVASANMVTATAQALLPPGAVMPFAMNSAPAGWLAANGNEYDKTGTYAALFEAISTTYGETNGSGGSGTSHFRVPDLRSIFVRGSGPQTISGKTYNKTFATKEQDAVITHTHQYATRTSTFGAASGTNGGVFIGTSTLETGSMNPAGAAETQPANIALLYCIKF
jgi:microcystin-dependent protein